MTQEALGMVETRGLTAAIEAADQMCKAVFRQCPLCQAQELHLPYLHTHLLHAKVRSSFRHTQGLNKA